MRDLAGVHDVSEGVAPAGTPAAGVNLLQKADQTQHARLRVEIETSAKAIAEWEIALEVQYAPAPYMLAYAGGTNSEEENEGATGLHSLTSLGWKPPAGMEPVNLPASPDGMGNPGNTDDQAQEGLEALAEGGMYHITVVPGSAFAQTPDEKNQELMMLWNLGIFAPEMAPAALTFLAASEFSNKDKLIEAIQKTQQQLAQAQQGKPSQKITESMAYKDLPPDVQRQMEAAAGFQPSQMPPPTEDDGSDDVASQQAQQQGQLLQSVHDHHSQMAQMEFQHQLETERTNHQAVVDIQKTAFDKALQLKADMAKQEQAAKLAPKLHPKPAVAGKGSDRKR